MWWAHNVLRIIGSGGTDWNNLPAWPQMTWHSPTPPTLGLNQSQQGLGTLYCPSIVPEDSAAFWKCRYTQLDLLSSVTYPSFKIAPFITKGYKSRKRLLNAMTDKKILCFLCDKSIDPEVTNLSAQRRGHWLFLWGFQKKYIFLPFCTVMIKRWKQKKLPLWASVFLSQCRRRCYSQSEYTPSLCCRRYLTKY